MKRAILISAAVALAFAAPVGATRGKEVSRFAVGAAITTHVLPGRATDIQLVKVSTRGYVLRFGDTQPDGSVTMYGHGLVLHFGQRGDRHYVRAVSLAGRQAVTVTYVLG